MIKKSAVLLMICLLVFSCNDDEEDDRFSLVGTELSMDDIEGNWEAYYALFENAASGPVTEFEVISNGGEVYLDIQSNGRFTMEIEVPNEPELVYTGQLGFDEDLLVVQVDGEDDYFYLGISLDNGELYISGGPIEDFFDLDDDGNLDDSYVKFEFERE
ncbi:hypothetical protein [Marinigracilibium pacificum]|uniref:Lipocalin-like domain-containing protein n=1 Tax=Marinigracilibium pacificum TaxID=2729599 RepID=A0A848IXT3_9BACT|nr:hypothetical protein [Marinigracilibium pacificum]NMM48131.1 hypothetical protein [Marinigracilibium pacificum]